MTIRGILAAVTLTLAPAVWAQDNVWSVAPLDSFANFSVKHLIFSTVHGSMGGMKGTIVFDPNDVAKDSVEASLEVSTLNTGTVSRDDELKDSYFDIKKYPQITFKSSKVIRSGPNMYKVTGDLSMKGVTKSVTLDVAAPPNTVKDAQGRTKRAFIATTKINRKDYGITGTKLDNALEGGGIIVSDEVELELDIEVTAGATVAPPQKPK